MACLNVVSAVAMLADVNQRAACDVVELKVFVVRAGIEEESSEVQAPASESATKTHIQSDLRRIVVEACASTLASSARVRVGVRCVPRSVSSPILYCTMNPW